MTMRRRVLSIRISDAEYQALKAQADAAGMSVPVLVRRFALESVQIGPRLDNIERLIRDVPDRSGMIAAFQRLAEKIDRVGSKGSWP